ncbi:MULTISPECIES: hypothetical protein [Shewanella]|uniref:hypothetical protein n=1 Tax=Shewanella TaxID=22 RepID=UPI001EFC8E40|nr:MULTISPECIES: hypothetical protein [Shewanella]MCG9745766.1 hypothetical protein [Shewanella sp. Isolate8]MCL1040776.1 hypothetical protein [Shewanella marisflavi]
MRDSDLPITDWSMIGRQNYVDENRLVIELVIEQALEEFEEKTISVTFGHQDTAVDKIINLFLLSHFCVERLPTAIPKDITLFSELSFWVSLKTAGNVNAGGKAYKQAFVESEHELPDSKVADIDRHVQPLARNLKKLSKKVAPDLIGYWLQANKKLLNELAVSDDLSWDIEIENEVSAPQITRYKVDASFRYLYQFLNIKEHINSVELYENKYFVKGLNRPQYVAEQSETHQTKHQVRQKIKQIINRFHSIHTQTGDNDFLTRALFKAIAKKAVLDVYEINKNEPYYSDYAHKLKQLKNKPSTILEQVS